MLQAGHAKQEIEELRICMPIMVLSLQIDSPSSREMGESLLGGWLAGEMIYRFVIFDSLLRSQHNI